MFVIVCIISRWTWRRVFWRLSVIFVFLVACYSIVAFCGWVSFDPHNLLHFVTFCCILLHFIAFYCYCFAYILQRFIEFCCDLLFLAACCTLLQHFVVCILVAFFFQAEDGIRDCLLSRGLGDVYKRQVYSTPIKLFGDVKPARARVRTDPIRRLFV